MSSLPDRIRTVAQTWWSSAPGVIHHCCGDRQAGFSSRYDRSGEKVSAINAGSCIDDVPTRSVGPLVADEAAGLRSGRSGRADAVICVLRTEQDQGSDNSFILTPRMMVSRMHPRQLMVLETPPSQLYEVPAQTVVPGLGRQGLFIASPERVDPGNQSSRPRTPPRCWAPQPGRPRARGGLCVTSSTTSWSPRRTPPRWSSCWRHLPDEHQPGQRGGDHVRARLGLTPGRSGGCLQTGQLHALLPGLAWPACTSHRSAVPVVEAETLRFLRAVNLSARSSAMRGGGGQGVRCPYRSGQRYVAQILCGHDAQRGHRRRLRSPARHLGPARRGAGGYGDRRPLDPRRRWLALQSVNLTAPVSMTAW